MDSGQIWGGPPSGGSSRTHDFRASAVTIEDPENTIGLAQQDEVGILHAVAPAIPAVSRARCKAKPGVTQVERSTPCITDRH